MCPNEIALVQIVLGLLKLNASGVGLVLGGDQVVSCATLVLLSSAVVVDFYLETSLVQNIPPLLCVKSLHVAHVTLLAKVCVLVLRLLPLLVPHFLVCHCEVSVKAVGV